MNDQKPTSPTTGTPSRKFWDILSRIFHRQPELQEPTPLNLPENQKTIVKSVSRLIVNKIASDDEHEYFDRLVDSYFANTTPYKLNPQYNPFGVGSGEPLVTPASTAVVVQTFVHISQQYHIAPSEWSEQQKKLNQSLDYETGLQRLLNQIPPQNPSYSDVLNFQVRLTENIQSARRYGDTNELQATRYQIVEQLNILALNTIGTSFNVLCNLTGGLEPVKSQELHDQILHISRSFGIEEKAEAIANALMPAILTVLWGTTGK
jgi:hypothetical protein